MSPPGRINFCAPMFDKTFSDVQTNRKAAFGELFIMYLIYMAIRAYSQIKNPPKPQGQQKDILQTYTGANIGHDDLNIQQKQVGQQERPAIDIEALDKFFPIFFGYHMVALGVALLYSPFQFTLAMAYIHLIFFIAVMVAYKRDKPVIKTGAFILCSVINLALIIGALVGLASSQEC